MATDTLDARGSRTADAGGSAEEARSAQECFVVRRKITSMLKSAASETPFIKQEDIDAYRDGISENAMRLGGANTYKQQLEWLKENESKYVPRMIEEAKRFQAQFREAISQAKGVLNAENIKNLEEVPLRRRGDWKDVKAFFTNDESQENSLRGWMKNWQTIGKRLRQIESLKKEVNGAESIRAVAELKESTFTSGKVKIRLAMVEEAFEKLMEARHGKDPLFAEARRHIEKGVQGKAVASYNVEKCLTNIFTKYKGKAAEDYVRNVLPGHVQGWVKDSKEFGTLSKDLKDSGVPVKSLEEYLEFGYSRRREELTKMQAELAKAKTGNLHPVLSQIEDAIDKDNLGAANTLADKAENMELSTTGRRKLFDLRQQIRMDEEADGKSESATKDPDLNREVDRTRADLVGEMGNLPPDLYKYYAWMLEQGGAKKWQRARRLRVWHYNIKWARDRGFIRNENAYEDMKEESEEDTQKIMEQGHRATGVEKMHLGKAGGGIESKHRQFDGGKSKGATYLFYDMKDPNSEENLKEEVDEELGNERKNYWGLAGAMNVRLTETCTSYDRLCPKLKALERAEKAANRATESVDLHNSSKSDAEPQFSMSA